MKQDKSKAWAKRIDEWEHSGLSQAAFCRERGLTPSNFHRWKARIKQQRPSPGPGAPKLVEVVGYRDQQGSSAPPLRLQIKGRFTLELAPDFSEALLLKTLRVLERL